MCSMTKYIFRYLFPYRRTTTQAPDPLRDIVYRKKENVGRGEVVDIMSGCLGNWPMMG
jgi:hypothetical protein